MQAKGLIATAGVIFSMSFNLMAIELGSIADSRFENSGGWTLDGVEMAQARAKLLEPANFGPGGTVSEAINITDVSGEITYTALSTFDIFFVGYLDDDDEDFLTEDEGLAMGNWVAAGGTMIITCDDFDHDAICIAFGISISATQSSPPASPTGVGATRPMFNGPFGAPNQLAMAGNRPFFDDTGGFSVLAEDQMGNPVILEALIGNGRVIALSDVDMISNDTLTEGTGIENANDQFLANLVAYLADEAGETFVLNPGMNGNWFGGPTRDGEGAQVELLYIGEVLSVVLTFYSYDTEGNQIFLVAVGAVNGNRAELNVFITEGGLWGANFDPELVNETPFGTAIFSSSHCGTAHLVVSPNADYEVQGYTEIEYDLQRIVPPAAPCPLAPVEP